MSPLVSCSNVGASLASLVLNVLPVEQKSVWAASSGCQFWLYRTRCTLAVMKWWLVLMTGRAVKMHYAIKVWFWFCNAVEGMLCIRKHWFYNRTGYNSKRCVCVFVCVLVCVCFPQGAISPLISPSQCLEVSVQEHHSEAMFQWLRIYWQTQILKNSQRLNV